MAPVFRSPFAPVLPLAPLLLLAFAPLFATAPAAAPQDPHEPPGEDPVAAEYLERFEAGIRALQEGRHDDGIAAFQRCLELQPEDETCAYNIACGYSLKGSLDPGFTWLDHALDWGFPYVERQASLLETDDPDLANLRADPRFEALVERMQGLIRAAEEYASEPGLHVPAALAEAERLPLLVVLHDFGSTKDAVLSGPWRRVADELGFALLAPSGRFPSGTDPREGMDWAPSPERYAGAPGEYERTVFDAVQAFRAEHELDRERVYLVGEGAATWIAFRRATTTPGLYRGCVLLNGTWIPELQVKAAHAAGRGLRVRVLFEVGRPLREFSDSAGPELVRNTVSTRLRSLGYPDPARFFRLDPENPDALFEELSEEIRALDEEL